MIQQIHQYTLPALWSLLPAPMTSDAARAMLLAIGLQETHFATRYQHLGPALGFWQFEPVTIAELLRRSTTSAILHTVLQRCAYPHSANLSTSDVGVILTHNDLVAAAFARCNLWRDPRPLPGPLDVEEAWRQYVTIWKPGRPHPATWAAYYRQAWDLVRPPLEGD